MRKVYIQPDLKVAKSFVATSVICASDAYNTLGGGAGTESDNKGPDHRDTEPVVPGTGDALSKNRFYN